MRIDQSTIRQSELHWGDQVRAAKTASTAAGSTRYRAAAGEIDLRNGAQAEKQSASASAAGVNVAAATVSAIPVVGPIIGAVLGAVAAVIALIGQVLAKGKESEAASREAPLGEPSLIYQSRPERRWPD